MTIMKKTINTIWTYKYVILTYALIIVLSIPLFALCKSAVPSADDFSYGLAARQAYAETGSFFSAAAAAAKNTAERYLTWQGTYSSIFIMSLQPAVFSLKLYRFFSVILLIITFICPAFLAFVLNKHIFKNDNKITYILAAAYTFINLQFWASMLEGIYWFNAAWYYTFSFEMVLVMIAVTVIFEKTKSKKSRITSYIFMLLLSFFLGGTNYPQLLMLTVGYSAFILMVFIRKNQKKWLYASNWVFMGICIAANAFAPGNMMNYQKHVNLTYTALKMISTFTGEFSSNPTIGISLVVSLISMPFLNKMTEKADIKFIKPCLLGVVTFLIVFSMYMPSAFIFHNEGPLRQINVRMMAMQFMIYVNVVNCVGYYIAKKDNKRFTLNKPLALILSLAILVTALSGGSIMEAWSIKAQYAVMNKDISRFTSKMNEAFDKLEDETVKTVDMSEIIVNEMLMSNINNFTFYNVGAFYDKEKVTYETDE